MSLSQSAVIRMIATGLATPFIGFGINAIFNPDRALAIFELPSPPADRVLVDSLMAVYGIRNIFIGFAVYAASFLGTSRSLGWTLIGASAVAFGDGAICWMHGHGQWGHWQYAPMFTLLGSVILGVFDGPWAFLIGKK